MTIFNGKRGDFMQLDLDTSKGQGIQVSLPGIPGDGSLVTSFSVAQSENYAVSQCLDGTVYLYTYGHNPQASQFTLGVTSFLNSCGGSVGKELATALAAYRESRVSSSKNLVTLTIGTGYVNGYLTGQNINVQNNEIGIITSVYTFVMLTAQ